MFPSLLLLRVHKVCVCVCVPQTNLRKKASYTCRSHHIPNKERYFSHFLDISHKTQLSKKVVCILASIIQIFNAKSKKRKRMGRKKFPKSLVCFVIIYVHPVCDTRDVPITARRYDSIFPARERRSCLAWRYQIYHPTQRGHVDRWDICR